MTEPDRNIIYGVELVSKPGKTFPALYIKAGSEDDQPWLVLFPYGRFWYVEGEVKQYWPLELPKPPREWPREGKPYWVKAYGEWSEHPLYLTDDGFGPREGWAVIYHKQVEDFRLAEPPND